MFNSSNRTAPMWSDQMLLDFEASATESIDLSPEIFDQALKLSSKIPNEERQWQTYLNVLALGGFEEWLGSRATNLMVNREDCSVLQPSLAKAINAVSNLKVDEFKLCLITTGSFTDDEVTLPRAVVDLPEFIPHFYVLVEVLEEQEAATVQGFLSYTQLMNRRDEVNLEADRDWTYQLPLSCFDGKPDDLVMHLRCLEPTAIALPACPQNRPMQLAQMRSQLEALLPELHSSDRELWEVLSWEQGGVVLTNPELLNWVYQLQLKSEQKQPITSLKKHLADTLQLLTEPAVNAGRWVLGELDNLAQELSWVLLPSLAPTTAMRSPAEEFEAIVAQLRQTEVDIPLEARGAYRDLRLAGMPLRLYAITWPLLSGSIPEWTLLLVLGATPGTQLPSGLQMRVSDQSGILVEQALDKRALRTSKYQNPYFFTRVIGSWDEKFLVTVRLPSGIEQTIPPFSFNPKENTLSSAKG
jgi:hypothetical protein